MAAVNCNAAAACTRAAAPPRQASASSPAAFGQPSRQLRAAHSASLSGQAVGAHRVGYYRSHRLRAAPAPRAMARFETERTYVMIKPDGVQRGLVGNVISRFEAKGFVLKGLKLFQCPQALAEEHYKDLSAKPFFKDLVTYICSGPVVAMVWEGPRVVSSARKIIGATNPAEAEPGTIRGDLAVEVGRNVVHGSDSAENGEREIKLWFQGAGVVDWSPTVLPWLREM